MTNSRFCIYSLSRICIPWASSVPAAPLVVDNNSRHFPSGRGNRSVRLLKFMATVTDWFSVWRRYASTPVGVSNGMKIPRRRAGISFRKLRIFLVKLRRESGSACLDLDITLGVIIVDRQPGLCGRKSREWAVVPLHGRSAAVAPLVDGPVFLSRWVQDFRSAQVYVAHPNFLPIIHEWRPAQSEQECHRQECLGIVLPASVPAGSPGQVVVAHHCRRPNARQPRNSFRVCLPGSITQRGFHG